jgi:hypothetical protein
VALVAAPSVPNAEADHLKGPGPPVLGKDIGAARRRPRTRPVTNAPW